MADDFPSLPAAAGTHQLSTWTGKDPALIEAPDDDVEAPVTGAPTEPEPTTAPE